MASHAPETPSRALIDPYSATTQSPTPGPVTHHGNCAPTHPSMRPSLRRPAQILTGEAGAVDEPGCGSAVPAHHQLHRVALGIGHPGGAHRAEEVVRLRERPGAPVHDLLVGRVDVVGPEHHPGARLVAADVDPVHPAGRLDAGH